MQSGAKRTRMFRSGARWRTASGVGMTNWRVVRADVAGSLIGGAEDILPRSLHCEPQSTRLYGRDDKAEISGGRCCGFVGTKMPLEKQVHDEILDVGKYLTEDNQADEQAGNGKTVAAQPVQVLLCAGFAHEQHDGGAAIEGRNGQKIKSAEQEIHHEHSDEGGKEEAVVAVWLTVEEVHGTSGT